MPLSSFPNQGFRGGCFALHCPAPACSHNVLNPGINNPRPGFTRHVVNLAGRELGSEVRASPSRPPFLPAEACPAASSQLASRACLPSSTPRHSSPNQTPPPPPPPPPPGWVQAGAARARNSAASSEGAERIERSPGFPAPASKRAEEAGWRRCGTDLSGDPKRLVTHQGSKMAEKGRRPRARGVLWEFEAAR